MPVRAAILDISGTLAFGEPPTLIQGAKHIVEQLRKIGIEVFLATNHFSRDKVVAQALNIAPEMVLHPELVGGKKGKGRFVSAATSKLGIGLNELLYLGNDDYDFFEAINHGVLFFNAQWANPTIKYGIPVSEPQQFTKLIETFFLKESLWYFLLEGLDQSNREVSVRALIGPDEAKNTGITSLLKNKVLPLKSAIMGYPLDFYLSLHLLASVYLEGLHLIGQPVWCLYPAHAGSQTGILERFAGMAAQLFKDKYFRPDLIQRHIPAESRWRSRLSGANVSIDEQLKTIQLNAAYRSKIKGSHVLVIDDFMTEGDCFETARNFLLNAGVGLVTTIAVGRYGFSPYIARSPKADTKWDSFLPSQLTEQEFSESSLTADYDKEALQYFARLPAIPRSTSSKKDVPNAELPSVTTPKPIDSKVKGANTLLETLLAEWPRVKDLCRTNHALVAGLLSQASVIEVNDEVVPLITVESRYDFHVRALNEETNRKVVEWAITQVLGMPVSVEMRQKKQRTTRFKPFNLS